MANKFEYQGQEVIEAKGMTNDTQGPVSSVQMLKAKEIASVAPQMGENVVARMRQLLYTRRNNDDKWDQNGNKVE
jgi:hypothetical protein